MGHAISPPKRVTMSAVTAELLADHLDRFVLPGADALVFANTVAAR